jgi:hypothetical protein
MRPDDFARLVALVGDESVPARDRIEPAEEVVQAGQLPLAQRLRLLRACIATTDTMVRRWSVCALARTPARKSL